MKNAKVFTVNSSSADTYDPQNLIQCSYIQKDGQLLNTTAMIDTGAHRSVVSFKTIEKIEFEMGQRRRRKYVGATNHEMKAGIDKAIEGDYFALHTPLNSFSRGSK